MGDKKKTSGVQNSKHTPKAEETSTEKTQNNKFNLDKLELLITIVNRTKAEFYVDLIQSFDVNMQMTVKARGTASVEMLELLGIEDQKKSVIFSIIKEEKIKDVLLALDSKFKTIKNGKGIAYTIPMSSIIGVAIYGFLSNNKMTVKENKDEKV